MSTDVVVLLTSGVTDATAADAIGHLSSLAHRELVRPFWSVINDGSSGATWTALYHDDGSTPVSLFDSLAAVVNPTIFRLVVVCAVDDPLAVASLVAQADTLVGELERYVPHGTPVVQVRVAAPSTVLSPTPLAGLFSTHAHSNVVIIPEDRGSHTGFAAPVERSSDRFAGNVAYEVASLAGLWSAMTSAWVDQESPGVIDGTDCKLRFVQSQTRVLDLPPPMLEAALSAELIYPTPLGFQAAPDQSRAAAKAAEALYRESSELHFTQPEAFESRVTTVTLGEAFSRMAGEWLKAVAKFPQRTAVAAASNVKHVLVHFISHVLGDERVIEPIFDGQVKDFAKAADLPDIDAPIEEALAASAIDQGIWTRFVDATFAAIDGGAAAGSLAPLVEGTQRFALVDPAAIAPRLVGTSSAAADQLLRESLTSPQPTLVGRFTALLNGALTEARGTLARARSEYDALLERIKNARKIGTPALLRIAIALLVALVVLTIAIPGGVAESAGVADWSRPRRAIVGIIAAALAMISASVCLASILEARRRAMLHAAREAVENAAPGHPVVAVEVERSRARRMVRRAWAILGVVVLVGILGGWGWSNQYIDTGHYGILRLGEVVAIGSVVVALAGVIVAAYKARGMSGADAAMRTAVATLIVYVTLAIIGGVVDRQGWYGTSYDGPEHYTRNVVIQVVVLAALAAFAFWWRAREHLQFDDSRVRLGVVYRAVRHCMAEQARLATAVSQFLGTAVATSRLVWQPYGELIVGAARQPFELGTPELRKMRVGRYDVDENKLPVLYDRIRTMVSDHGWLRRQYAAAMESYRRQYLRRVGRNPGGVTNFRPEADRTTSQRREGLRWEFADQLMDGQFDADLRAAVLSHSTDKAIADLMLTDGLLAGPTESLNGFIGDIALGSAAPLRQELFARLSMVIGGDERAKFDSELWWPVAVSDPPSGGEVTVHPVDAFVTAESTLVMAIRTERSQVFPLHRMPITELEEPSDPNTQPDWGSAKA